MITENKVYRCLTMPFGWKNAPSAFMRAMATVFEGLEDIVYYYMDDIVVMTKEDDFEKHLEHLALALQRLIEYNVKGNPKKCELARERYRISGA